MKWIKSLLARRRPALVVFDEPANKELLEELKGHIKDHKWAINYHKDKAIYYKQRMIVTEIAIEVLEKNK